MKIVHLSDLHFGSEELILLDPLCQRIAEIRPDLVVASGDFTMAGRHNEYRQAAAFLARLPGPIIATPGNHDLPVYNLIERFTHPFRRFKRYIGPLITTEFTSPDVAMLALNSAREWDFSLDWSRGRLSDRQVSEADRFFERGANSRFRALVVHHPFFVPEELPGFRRIGNGDAMLHVLAKRGVHAVLSGHLHQQCVATRELVIDEEARSVILLQVASAISTRRRNQPNAFNVLEVKGDSVTLIEQVEHNGQFEPQLPRPVLPLTTSVEHRPPGP